MAKPPMTDRQSTTPPIVTINCPSCGHAFSGSEMAQVRGAMVAESEDETEMEPTSPLEAMNRELDDPKRQKERAARKE